MHISALYESVTNRIIEEMKNGTVPWTKPWKSGKTTGVMPMNAVTGRAYSGINIPLLWHAADVHAYPMQAWLTYKQALAAVARCARARNRRRSSSLRSCG
jgi:antirestriction protein ArdC